jgi:hypothetical protein
MKKIGILLGFIVLLTSFGISQNFTPTPTQALIRKILPIVKKKGYMGMASGIGPYTNFFKLEVDTLSISYFADQDRFLLETTDGKLMFLVHISSEVLGSIVNLTPVKFDPEDKRIEEGKKHMDNMLDIFSPFSELVKMVEMTVNTPMADKQQIFMRVDNGINCLNTETGESELVTDPAFKKGIDDYCLEVLKKYQKLLSKKGFL